MKESFLIYKSFYKPIEKFTDEQLGKLFRAIFDYQLGKEPNVPDDIYIAFAFFRNQFEIDDEKYKKKIAVLSENGKKKANDSKCKQLIANDSKCKQLIANDSKCKQLIANEQMIANASKSRVIM